MALHCKPFFLIVLFPGTRWYNMIYIWYYFAIFNIFSRDLKLGTVFGFGSWNFRTQDQVPKKIKKAHARKIMKIRLILWKYGLSPCLRLSLRLCCRWSSVVAPWRPSTPSSSPVIMFVSHRHHSRRCGCRMVRISLSVFELVSLMFFSMSFSGHFIKNRPVYGILYHFPFFFKTLRSKFYFHVINAISKQKTVYKCEKHAKNPFYKLFLIKCKRWDISEQSRGMF